MPPQVTPCFQPTSPEERQNGWSRYNIDMLRDLRPLFPYMRRYRWGYAWGIFACICTNAIWVQFPRVLQSAINDLKKGTTFHHITWLACS